MITDAEKLNARNPDASLDAAPPNGASTKDQTHDQALPIPTTLPLAITSAFTGRDSGELSGTP